MMFMKNATPITAESKQTLKEMWRNHPTSRCRQRAHGILLSVSGYTIVQIAQLLEVERRAVSAWIDHWESLGLIGLYDQPRSGRPTMFTEEEQALLLTLIAEEPRQLKSAQVKMADITGKPASCYTLKRVLKNSSMSGNAAAVR
jgi:transposase